MKPKILTVIPVRMASTRLPGKPLVDILGKSMIHRVYEKALEANLGEILIACDGQEIAEEAKKIGANFVITDPNLNSGTDRIYAASRAFIEEFPVVLNLQGDLPNIDPKVLQLVANAALNKDCDIATAASVIKNPAEINNPNVVKIAINDRGKALYFSRSPIPYNKDISAKYLHHIGIYAYKTEALKKFVNLKPSTLEKRESLEQLRALENEMSILVELTDAHPLSVDTKEDLQSIISILSDEAKR